jgi:hypothetical protein
MAISRFLMNRQLRANGGIMDVTPRENFGIGSSLKKFVRKIIPNEVADIAVKAAPFVAPFNPALAGAMSGIGTFDQTGSIGDSLKAGGMNYALGQGARYVGGAGMQGNPFAQGGAFTQGGFQGGFSSPLGNQTGLGKLFSNQGTDPVQSINSGRGGTSASALSRSTANVPSGAEQFATADSLGVSSFIPEVTADAAGVTSQLTKETILKQPGVFDSITESIKNFDYKGLGNKTLELGKKFGKAMFTNKDGSIDRAAVMGAIAFAGSYAEALALADDAGVELTEEAYDEAKKTEKQEEYAGYLTNFFGGKKDGGRIGLKDGTDFENYLKGKKEFQKQQNLENEYREYLENKRRQNVANQKQMAANGGRIGYGNGANEFMSEQMMLESNPGAAESGSPITIDTTMTGLINKYNTYKKSAPNVSEETRIFLKNDLLKSLEDAGISQEEFMMRLSEDTEMKANGGRIGYGLGDLVRGSAGVFQPTSASMSAGDAPSFEGGSGMGGMIVDLIRKNPQMFKNVSGQTNSSGGPMPSGSMGGMFSNFFSNPNIYNQFIKNKKDFIDQNLNLIDDREEVANGGRIGYALGTPRDTTMFEELNADTIYRPEPDSTITLPNEMPGGDNRMPGDDRRVDKYDDYEFDQDKKTDSIRLLADFYMREEGMSESDAYEKAVGEIYDIQLKEGGRVSRKLGSPEEGERSGVMEMLAVDVDAGGDDKEENMMMADISFNSAEKSFLFKNLAKLGGADRSINMPKLYGILKNPNNPRNLEDARMLKAFIEIKMPGFKSGGRIGYVKGGNRVSELLITRAGILAKDPDADVSDIDGEIFQLTGKTFKSIGGISEIPTGQPRLNQGGVAERDYRETGGFVPVGIKERADDVPAMLSKNEFVMTADSVRGLGNGSVEEGSKKLYNTMKQAEQKGKIA